jgi:hypothetical protein
MARYCPNCSAELKISEAECWNCEASFGPNSSWAPTDAPSGVFAARERTTATAEREERHAPGWPRKNTVVTLAMLVRTLLQVLLIGIYLVGISGALTQPTTGIHIGDMIGVSLFFVLLFVATLSIGESKKKQSAHVLGYMVNPKSFGVMLVGLGAFLLFAAWRALSGHALGESPSVYGRGMALVELVFQIPVLLVPAGLASAWYGVKLFRTRRASRRHRRRNAA